MTFRCYLTPPAKCIQDDVPKLPRGGLDYESLVMEACALLSKTDCQFVVGGFGHDDWHLDIAYDLSTVIEQLPSLLAALRGGQGAEIDLYSQGIERTLVFAQNAEIVTIECHSRTSWVPSPDIETASFDDLLRMFISLAQNFAASLELVDPGSSTIPPFDDWRLGQT